MYVQLNMGDLSESLSNDQSAEIESIHNLSLKKIFYWK